MFILYKKNDYICKKKSMKSMKKTFIVASMLLTIACSKKKQLQQNCSDCNAIYHASTTWGLNANLVGNQRQPIVDSFRMMLQDNEQNCSCFCNFIYFYFISQQTVWIKSHGRQPIDTASVLFVGSEAWVGGVSKTYQNCN